MAGRKVPLHPFLLVLGALTLGIPLGATGQLTPAQRATLVLRLLPTHARSGATVILRDSSGEDRYREGYGRFLCASDVTNPDRISMVCHHTVLEQRLRFERQLSRETDLTGQAFNELLCAEVARRGWSVPDGAMEITASLARNADGTYASEMMVYHLLWLPHQTSADIGVDDRDPGDGRPYLHQGGTCGAHVMWSRAVPASLGES